MVGSAALKMVVEFSYQVHLFLSFSVFLAVRAALFRAVFCISRS